MRSEIRAELRRLPTGDNDLRKFGITMAIIIGLLTVFTWYRDSAAFPYLLAIAAAFLVGGLAFARALKPVYYAWMGLAVVLGMIMSTVILALLFFTVFTVIALIFKLQRRDPLDRQYDRGAATYWKPYARHADVRRHLERQF